MVTRYVGPLEYTAYLQDVIAEELTISPGGAAIMLGVSRQRVYQMLQHPGFGIRAWAYHDAHGQAAQSVDISLADLVRYAVARGRTRPEEFGVSFSRLADLIERAKAGEVLPTPA